MSNYYAQENYTEDMGNGPFSIKEIGCFVTAFSNLLVKFGKSGVTPPNLNTYFTEHNDYLADPADGARVKDDLAWGTITAYDSDITVASTGSGSWPNSDNSIVKFVYEENNQSVTHFCLVNSVASKTIVDSWDGTIKEPGKYGSPVAWASYEDKVPQSVPIPIPTSQNPTPEYGSYSTVTPLPGYTDATEAANGTNSNSTVPVGSYTIFNKASNGMINITAKAGVPGWWINPTKNVLANVPAPVEAPTYTIITVQSGWGLERIAAAAGRTDANQVSTWSLISTFNGDTNWESFNAALKAGQQVKVPYQPGQGTDDINVDTPFQMSTNASGTYIATNKTDVFDTSDYNKKPIPLGKGTKVIVTGTFFAPTIDGATDILFARPQFASRQGTWYGIPMTNLEKTGALSVKSVDKLSLHDRLVVATAKVEGLVEKKKAKKAS